MPAYNAGRFIEAAVNSILDQTFQDFELIILDDGSNDDTVAIIQGYSDHRIRLIQKDNEGVATTLNRGIELSQGEYIWRHDADDVSTPDRLAQQVQFLNKHHDVLLCSTQIAFMTERGNIARNKKQPKSVWFDGQPWKVVGFDDFSPYSPVTHATILVRSSILRELKGYRVQFKTAEDTDLWLRMMEFGKLVVLNQCGYYVRLSASSATAVHGWKNEFYRELAKTYFQQRQLGRADDLEAQGFIQEPTHPIDPNGPAPKSGTTFRADLLNFHYAVHLDARDWRECGRIIWLAWRSGWRRIEVYKAIFLPLLPQAFVNMVTSTKARFRENHTQP